jgi:hypothetical protein
MLGSLVNNMEKVKSKGEKVGANKKKAVEIT